MGILRQVCTYFSLFCHGVGLCRAWGFMLPVSAAAAFYGVPPQTRADPTESYPLFIGLLPVPSSPGGPRWQELPKDRDWVLCIFLCV